VKHQTLIFILKKQLSTRKELLMVEFHLLTLHKGMRVLFNYSLNRTFIFDQCVVRIKNKHHKSTCFKRTIFSIFINYSHSIVNTIGKIYVLN
jgi:hypothetical protein